MDNEEERLRTLYSYDILDTVEERSFDDLCRLCAQICEVPISLITLIDRRRQWFKSHVGWDVRETDRDCSFCAHAIQQDGMLLVPDATDDARFMDNRLVLAGPKIRSYAGVPVRAYNGMKIGTLCAIDRVPRHLDEDQRRALMALARQVESQLELRRIQREKDQLGQFVVHDLRNPLGGLVLTLSEVRSSVEGGELPTEALMDLELGLQTLHRRVLDLQDVYASEHGQLRPHFQLLRVNDMLRQIQRQMRPHLAAANVVLETKVGAGADEVRADAELLRRIIENFAYNALEVAPEGTAIRVDTAAEHGQFVLRVTDEGPGVEVDDRARIFELYGRGDRRTRRGSRGLGLAFCRLAAKAMGGDVSCESPPEGGACFQLILP